MSRGRVATLPFTEIEIIPHFGQAAASQAVWT
jgi:hypothetical protein